MSIVSRQTRHRGQDHFLPEANIDPTEQRKLRGHLEQIDYAAFAANTEVLAKALGGQADLAHFQRMAVAVAHARANWLQAAVAAAGQSALSPEEAGKLAALRQGYEELSEAYEGFRRLVERGYLPYAPKV